MKLFSLSPEILQFATLREFLSSISLNKNDLIITNAYILSPVLGSDTLCCNVLYQEDYGKGEPTDRMVELMYEDFPVECKRIIAIGGGTIIDIAKLFILKHPTPVIDIFQKNAVLEKVRSLIIIPTTCGTGSEITNISIISFPSLGTKKGISSNALYADKAVLIPEMLSRLPFMVFATSSIDALIHGIESVLSPKATIFSRLFGYQAIQIILRGYKQMTIKGIETRFQFLSEFLTASTFGGISFSIAGCATIHALSYPLGANYHIPHGESNYLLLMSVLHLYDSLDPSGEIINLKKIVADTLQCSLSNCFFELELLLSKILQRKPLRTYGIKQENIALFVKSVFVEQTRLLENSYAPLNRAQVYSIYSSIY